MTEHAKLSPSSAHQWMACPGSVKAQEGLPDTAGAGAFEGTVAHRLNELCYVVPGGHRDPFIYVGETSLVDGVPASVTDEMARHTEDWLAYIDTLATPNAVVLTEQRLALDPWAPGQFGTADAVVFAPGVAHIVDYKFGFRAVNAEGNAQLMLYALGAIEEYGAIYEFDTVVLHIVQPRAAGGSPDPYSTTVDELRAFGAEVQRAAELALSDGAPRVPGAIQCQWCKAASSCPALRDTIFDVLEAQMPGLTSTDTSSRKAVKALALRDDLAPEDWPKGLEAVAMAKILGAAIESEMLDHMRNGGSVPGYKLVEARTNRRWKSEPEAVRWLQDNGYEDEKILAIRSPAQIEKVVEKDHRGDINALVEKPPGSPVFAKVSDKRPAISPVEVFDDLTEEK